jgi:hypothetical protein
MRILILLTCLMLFIPVTVLFCGNTAERIDMGLDVEATQRAGEHPDPDNPPPIDSTCLVYTGVDYGGVFNSPQGYPNAKHITNVMVGSYYFPVVIWQMGLSWDEQCVFSYWDDLFKFWSYPDSFSTSIGNYSGRTGVCADGHGNLHFAWYQRGNPDDYEVFYTRALIDTSSMFVVYTVERPGVMVSETNGEFDRFSSIALWADTIVFITWTKGEPANAAYYNYSTDAGTTWAGAQAIYEHGGPMPSGWQLNSVAPDPTTGDMWVMVPWDYSGDGCQDIAAYRWEAATNTWIDELAAEAPNYPHPYAVPAVAVDYNGVPHVVLQENLADDGGVNGTLSGYNECGPAGTLFYVHRNGGSWSTPMKIFLHANPYRNYMSGYPSVGVASDNTVYFTTTLPESATADTVGYYPFNAHYGEISPYTGAISYGANISGLPLGETENAIYPQMTQFVPIGGEVPADMQGPGVTWSQLIAAAPPADIYYNHSDTLLGIEEGERIARTTPTLLYQNCPNPCKGETVIKFLMKHDESALLTIHDIAGRTVREWSLHAPLLQPSGIIWDGKDMNGHEVPGGVYLYTLASGTYSATRKLILLK